MYIGKMSKSMFLGLREYFKKNNCIVHYRLKKIGIFSSVNQLTDEVKQIKMGLSVYVELFGSDSELSTFMSYLNIIVSTSPPY